jgi:SpoVK/Ycf46/Vps4 family AAA+-type ATPase
VQERKEIFQVHLARHSVVINPNELEYLAGLSQGFVGAEIRSAVDEAALAAFDEDLDTIELRHLQEVLAGTVPLAQSQPEMVAELRRWATVAAKNMSTVEPQPAKAAATKNSKGKRSAQILLEAE